jgi:hypothetical protein
MKIENIFSKDWVRSTPNQAIEKETTEIEFQKFLEEAKKKQGIVLTPTANSPNVSPLSKDGLNFRLEGIQRLDNLLDKFLIYKEALGNSEKTLKEIEPIIQSLSEEVDQLKKIGEKLPSSDPLNKILIELGVLSSVEIMKFKKGEYNFE